MLNFLWLQTACENCSAPERTLVNVPAFWVTCVHVCVCVVSQVVLTGTLAAVWLATVGWGGLCPVISRYSKQTDSPSLKLSLEAWDEMAQIMRHIINHRQGAAGSVYMCHTHTQPLSPILSAAYTQPPMCRMVQRRGLVASQQNKRSLPKQYFDSAFG